MCNAQPTPEDPIPDIDLASDDEEMPPTPIKQAAAAKPAANTPVDPEEITADMGRLAVAPLYTSSGPFPA